MADGFLYYVMPYVKGESLRDKLDRESQHVSPDRRLLAFVSEEEGMARLYVRRWPSLEEKIVVSEAGVRRA